MEMLVNVKTVT